MVGNPKTVFAMGVKMTFEHYINICDRAQIVNIEHYNEAKKSFPDSNRFILIPNPGSLEKSYTGTLAKKIIREKYNIQTKYVLTSVGAVNKGIKRMDDVVKEASKLSEDWTFVLVGKNQDNSIIKLGKKLLGERFIYLFVAPNDIPELYYMSDLTTLASTVEGFPNVILEATQNGIVPILYYWLLNKWAVKDDPLLVNMLQENTLSNLINNIDKKWMKEKGGQCKNIYNNNYSWNVLRKQYLDLLLKRD